MKNPAVYIMSNKTNGTLYIGVTSHLQKRVWQHRSNAVKGFTKRYGLYKLVYYEQHESMGAAIIREKQLKKWERTWKVRLIEEMNPEWGDLYDSLF